jgi:MoxR-like ATPase
MASASDYLNKLIDSIDTVIHGKEDQISLIMAVWLASGHVLLEDVPGTGKTLLAKTISKVMGLDYNRVQFTPDLLPSDILGSLILNAKDNKLELRKGPIFTSLFLGDEINRATPRTQSALLEAMAEKHVTIDGTTHELDELFFVMATQNPIEQHGTFPLPEAQLDRFMVKLSLGYPDYESEMKMIMERFLENPIDKIKVLSTANEIIQIKELVNHIKIDKSVLKYIIDLIHATRSHPDIATGASPRSSLALVQLSKSFSLLKGKSFVSPSIVYDIFPKVMNHRIQLKPDSKFSGKEIESITEGILKSVKAPILK